MGSTPVEEFNKVWSQRIASYGAHGISAEQLSPIIKKDWSRVQQGAAPYTGIETDQALASALSGQSIIPNAPKPHGILGAIRNIPSDIGGIAQGMTGMVGNALTGAWEATVGHDPAKGWDKMKQGWTWQQAGALGIEGLASLVALTGIGDLGPSEAVAAGGVALEEEGAAAAAEGAATAAEDAPKPGRFAPKNPTQAIIKSAAKKVAAGLMADQGVEMIQKGGLAGVEEHPVGTLLMFTPLAKEVSPLAAMAIDPTGTAKAGIADKAEGIAEAKRRGIDLKAGPPEEPEAPVKLADPKEVARTSERVQKWQDKLAQNPDDKRAQSYLTKAQQALDKAQNPEQPPKPEPRFSAEDLSKRESVVEALQKGKPLKAAYRAALPEAAQNFIGHRVDGFLTGVGIGPKMADLARRFSDEKTRMGREFAKFKEDLADHFTAMTPEEIKQFYDYATRPDLHDWSTLPADTQTMLARVADWNDNMARYSGVDQETLARDGFARGQGLFGIMLGDQKLYFADQGAEGEIANALEAAFKSHADIAEAQKNLAAEEAKTARRVATLTKRLSSSDPGVVERARAELDKIRESGRTDHNAAKDRLTKVVARNEAKNQVFLSKFLSKVPASYAPMADAQVREMGVKAAQEALAKGTMTTEAAHSAIESMKNANYRGTFSDAQWKAWEKEVSQNWLQLASRGLAPVWVHTVAEARFGPESEASLIKLGKALSDRYNTADHLHQRIFISNPTYENVALAMSRTAASLVESWGVKRFVNDYLMPRTLSAAQVEAELKPLVDARMAQGKVGDNPELVRNQLRDERFKEFDPKRYGIRAARRAAETKMYLPAEVDEMFRKTISRGAEAEAPARGLMTKSSNIMRKSLFFEPRHIAHLTLGSGFAGMLRGGLEEVVSFRKAWQLVRDGNIPPGVEDKVESLSGEQMWQMAEGKTVGRILGTVGGGIQKFEETFNNWARTTSFLAEKMRAEQMGMTDIQSTEAGLAHIKNTYMDMSSMTPFEQMILRQYFPFYAFNKYVMRYLLTFPMDHPIRAAVITSMGEQEQKLWDSGLPQTWMGLMSLGDANHNGEIAVANVRSFNPFRDAGNLFTLTGIVQGLNPLLHVGLHAMGVDTMSGTADLYPQLSYDQKTGQIVAKRPGVGAMDVAGYVAPPVQTLDTIFGISAQARSLKASNPDAFRAMIFDQLGIPFAPYKVNITRERFQTARDRYQIASQDVTNALAGKGTGPLKARGNSAVAYQGRLVPANQLAAWLDQIQRETKGIAPKAVLPKLPPVKRTV